MATEMIERIAKKLADRNLVGGTVWPDLDDATKADYRKMAEIAIREMYTPTEAMTNGMRAVAQAFVIDLGGAILRRAADEAIG